MAYDMTPLPKPGAKFQPGAGVLLTRYGTTYRAGVSRVNRSGTYFVTYYDPATGAIRDAWAHEASLRPDPDHGPLSRPSLEPAP